jgi:AcrR family transcriptional regulator
MARTRKKNPNPNLSADRIVTEAMALIDSEGYDALSFRALGRRLGCEAMSIYHYFPSKQHLIDALVTLCLNEIEIPEPGLPFREHLRQFAQNWRATAIRHAAFTPILFTHRLNHPEALDWLDRSLHIFDGSDADSKDKATIMRVVGYYLNGASLDEALGYARGPSAANPVPGEDMPNYPRVMNLGQHFGPENHDHFFNAGLELLLDWAERIVEG